MKPKFVLNTKTNCLHIIGYCQHSQPMNPVFFGTEDEALAYGGRSISMCKTCTKKREQNMKEEQK